MNIRGKVITNPDEKKKVILKHFEDRMRKRQTVGEMKEIMQINDELFQERLKEATSTKSKPFYMVELEKVLKSLKNGKSKDPNNYICELFKEGAIGKDLKLSILMMMNKMKTEVTVPECLRKANITILHKKNSKLDLNNWRGIFVCSVLRTILMKLVHERTYDVVASNMTDSQIGARKGKSVRNHLFILNSILSDVLSSKNKDPVDLNIMDFKQMFDTEELPTVLNAFYESGVKNDMLAIVNEANKTVNFAVKTPNGMTKTSTIHNKVLQSTGVK